MTCYLHFTIGPVQGFVAQARRTRDFWGGSFLLSWLAGVAMREAQARGGEIIMPEAPNEYLDWIKGQGEGSPPRHGTVPNRFIASKAGGFTREDAEAIARAVREAWQALAALVWDKDLAQLSSLGNDTQAIWKQQVDGFWEIAWALTDDENAANLLDKRKNWRSHLWPEEPGAKCTVMDGWQELSGIEGVNKDDREKREDFWKQVRAKTGIADLAENEQLCAIAFIKRRFARHFQMLGEQKLIDMPSKWTLKGWKLDPNVPSVVFMAAVHWLESVLKKSANDEHLEELPKVAEVLAGNGCYGEWQTEIACIEQAWRETQRAEGARTAAGRVAALDGKLFFRHYLDQPKLYPDRENAKKLGGVLGRLAADGPLSPYYAVLMMDGDSMGSLISVPGDQGQTNRKLIPAALNTFTQQVTGLDGKGIVWKHNGFLIYAGGDDVLAILPLEDALPCATALRDAYHGAFGARPNGKHETIKDAGGAAAYTTVSAAIEFVHMKVPLGKVLHDVHQLLETVAKEGSGRDSIAVRVWNTGGMLLEWAQPWEIALDGGRLSLEIIADQFQSLRQKSGEGESGFSSKFFYRFREVLAMLYPEVETRKLKCLAGKADKTEDANSVELFSPDSLMQVLAAELLDSGVNRGLTETDRLSLAQALERHIKPLVKQCQPVIRDSRKEKEQWNQAKHPKCDGALLVRHLASKGVGRR